MFREPLIPGQRHKKVYNKKRIYSSQRGIIFISGKRILVDTKYIYLRQKNFSKYASVLRSFAVKEFEMVFLCA
jgi:hypothetical protein